ncbi:MAG: GNAT family N-acetyltransferase [Oscillibacter sp.]|nr:GNAT family N-acetyltransferase [Oscillibacter sp.]
MKHITTQNFRILCDFMDIRNFSTEIYEQDWRNGVPAPFLEYALSSTWMDTYHTHRWRIWRDGGKIAALVFHENPVSDAYISLRPGYEELAEELVAYASSDMPKQNGKNRLVLFAGQTALMEAAGRAGYAQTGGYADRGFDFRKPLDHPLPEGFRFVEPEKLDAAKIAECCWKGFDHEASEGPWDGEYDSTLRLMATPHTTYNYDVAIENELGEYVCFAGMWWTPENHLAYMEPLCTVPQYRRKGLAAAALSELYRRMKPLGATHMTGGADPFYEKLGFDLCIGWTFWEKP